MDGIGHISMEQSRHGAGAQRDMLGQRPSIQSLKNDEIDRPNPLQVSHTSSNEGRYSRSPNGKSSNPSFALRSASDTVQYNSRSPRSDLAARSGQPQAPPAELNKSPPSAHTVTNGHIPSTQDDAALKTPLSSPSKAHSYTQLRNISSPLPDARPSGHSSPPSPRNLVTPSLGGSPLRGESGKMPRTSSIDSAISTFSANTSHIHKASTDSLAAKSMDISKLINAAGSPEAVIHHLLKEKQHAAAQNSQLWKLVDKQRSLILGLNKDLERAMDDKERYKRKLKEAMEKGSPLPITVPAVASGEAGASIEHKSNPTEVLMPRRGGPADSTGTSTNAKASGESWPKEQTEAVAGNMGNPLLQDSHDKNQSTPSLKQDMHDRKYVVGESQTSARAVAAINTKDLAVSTHEDSGIHTAPIIRPAMSPTSSFSLKRSQTNPARPFDGPRLSLHKDAPTAADSEGMTPPRKAPPAPLNLGSAKRESLSSPQFGPEDHSGSDYDDSVEVDELPILDRGRKITRQEDDREREAALSKEKAARSLSEKEKGFQAQSSSSKLILKTEEPELAEAMPMPLSIRRLSPEPTSTGNAFLSPPNSLAGVLQTQDSQDESEIASKTISKKPPMSPGLPLSPRPVDRPLNAPTPRFPREPTGPPTASPPLSPMTGFVGLPLSPRAPRQAIPLPPSTPSSMAPGSPLPQKSDTRKDSVVTQGSGSSASVERRASLGRHAERIFDRDDSALTSQSSEAPQTTGIFRGFISEAYPGLLIPPNALPSIQIKVVSSRLRPSRQSLALKAVDDEPVFTLGVSARHDQQDLWQVEKPISSLQHIDHQLRQCPGFGVKLPERSLFTGHAPAKIDARKMALEAYFEAVLDTQLDEKAAIALCRYLSMHVSEPAGKGSGATTSNSQSGSPSLRGSDGKLKKQGYLTKRGKNFGGWKARYFVLDKPILEYYDSPGSKNGPLGQIKLHKAQIGKQSPRASVSPSRDGEGDGQYRHAFLIREPKRKDSSSFMDHVLCAENDAERDSWVAALLCYVEGSGSEHDAKQKAASLSSSSSSKMILPVDKSNRKEASLLADSPESEDFDSLHTVPYEETKPLKAPHVTVTPDSRSVETPSPTMTGTQQSPRSQPSQSKAISGPQNGAKISDVGAWGNKPMASPLTVQKQEKKRSFFGFRDTRNDQLGMHHSNARDLNMTQEQQEYQEHATNVKAAFGAPLSEAVEFCSPRGVDVCLPAVVYRCLQYLEARNAAGEEGIFRMSGSNNLIKHLRHKFNTEGDYDFLGENEPYCDSTLR